MDLHSLRSANHLGPSRSSGLIAGEDDGCAVLTEEAFKVMKYASARCHAAAGNNYVGVSLVSQRLGVLNTTGVMK